MEAARVYGFISSQCTLLYLVTIQNVSMTTSGNAINVTLHQVIAQNMSYEANFGQ